MNQQADILHDLSVNNSLIGKLLTRAFAPAGFKREEVLLISSHRQPICIFGYIVFGAWLAMFIYDFTNIIRNGTDESIIFGSAMYVTIYILYVPIASFIMILAAYTSRRIMIGRRVRLQANNESIQQSHNHQLSDEILRALGDIYHIDHRFIRLTDTIWHIHLFCPLGSPYRCELYYLICKYTGIEYTSNTKDIFDSVFGKSRGNIQSIIEDISYALKEKKVSGP